MDYDLYSLRILCKIIETGSFSKAAQTLGLSQPSVSQQVSKLEEQHGAKIFERVGHNIHLTEVGKRLHQFSIEILERANQFREDLNLSTAKPAGLVRYGMPESCQWTPHYRKIMSQIKDYPEIQFEIGIQPSEMILQDLLEGKIDFGFIVGERLNPAIRFEKFADEHYSALAARGDLLKSLEEKNFAELRIIGYPGWELFFTTWAKDHGIWNKIKNRISSPTVRIGTLAGAIHATQEGAGIAILPTHCVLDEIKNKKLKVYSGQSKTSTNPIYVVRRLGETLPKRSQLILDLLKKSKAELG